MKYIFAVLHTEGCAGSIKLPEEQFKGSDIESVIDHISSLDWIKTENLTGEESSYIRSSAIVAISDVEIIEE